MFRKKNKVIKFLIKNKPLHSSIQENAFKYILFLPENKNRIIEGGLRTKGCFKFFYRNLPLLTIVTVVFNARNHIENTIKSVINQTYENIEYIVIDGGSYDGTIEIIKKYENKIDYFVSEKDLGIYHAMNKGVRLSRGSTIVFLNAGDIYGIRHVSQILYNIQHKNLKNIIIYSDYKYYFNKIKYFRKKYSNSRLDRGMTLCHQSMFIGKHVYQKLGLYSLNFKFAADYEYALRAKNNNIPFIKSYCSNEVYFLYGGASNDNLFISRKEAMCINRKYFGVLSMEHLMFLYFNLKGLLKTLLIKKLYSVLGFKKVNYFIFEKRKNIAI